MNAAPATLPSEATGFGQREGDPPHVNVQGSDGRRRSGHLPAQILLVHDDVAFSEAVSRALRDADYEVLVFPDPLAALGALETAARLELLITRTQFDAGRSNGAALALMARDKRPGVKIMIICRPDFIKDVEDLGEVLMLPVSVAKVVETARQLLSAPAGGGMT